MALPASDNFNAYGDYALLEDQTNWSLGKAGLAAYSGAIYGYATGYPFCYWNADTFSTSQLSQVTIKSISAYHGIGPAVFCQASTVDYYAFYGETTSSQVIEVVSGSANTLSGSLTAFAATDVIKLTTSVSGSTTTLKAYINGAQEGTDVTDTSFTSGAAGVMAQNDSGGGSELDDWIGDDIAASGATGTLAVTDANDTSAITGLEVFTGTVSLTDANDTSAITGTAGVSITGTLSVTDSNDNSIIVGSEILTGTLSITDSNDTSTITGLEVLTGTLSVTDSNDTSIIVGSTFTGVSGIVSKTEDDDIPTATGNITLNITGSLSSILDNDLSSISGQIIFSGILNTTEENDSIVANGLDKYIAILNSTEENDSLTATGIHSITVTGTLNIIDENDSSIIIGTLPITGTIFIEDMTYITYIADPIDIIAKEDVIYITDESDIIIYI